MIKIIKNIKCLFGMHEYGVIKEYSKYSRIVACMNCKKIWGMNDDAKAFILWDKDLEKQMKIIYPEKKGMI